MKSFLNKSILFSLLLLIFFVAVRSLILYQKQNPELYKLDTAVGNVILGHSMPECSLNDSLIANTQNLSQGGEAYFYTYTKLKKLIEINPSIQTVYVSFSNNQLEKKMDAWTYDAIYITDKYPIYFFAMDWKEKKLLWQHNPKAVLQSEQLIIKNNVIDLVKYKGKIRPETYWGDYLHLDKQKVDSLLRVNYIQTIINEREKGISEVNLIYLKKIVEHCKEKNIELVFFRTPVHKVLRETYDEQLFDSIRSVHFDDVPFLDFIDFPLPNEAFRDFSHLNYKGAQKFSIFFSKLVEQKITSELEVKKLIDSKIDQDRIVAE